ncbi:GNAT family N-acetyltransferase [Bermanella marisrubri]|uniref:N-acetyltransferase domain-containing protein n=1 Tax=Bermanella marisrubri TaxID=207949 RepID=Q1MY52_9GAMM|nr:GNAT family N-acetyltransferase [Bermanella marisrubri]EAT10908.1 hypothetical protein RED65_12695 [Oceanobacter sp. RED65] [Bermanella marisrubri]QIZ85325.1 GNAT family N-acetyltransferase [Bermanella marisrubri]
MEIIIEPVNNKQRWTDFLSIPNIIYREDADYCLEIKSETQTELSHKNPVATQCTVQSLVAYKNGNPCARCVCIINPSLNKKMGKSIGLIGYLEFVEDEAVLNSLLMNCEAYFSKKDCSEIWAGVRFSLNYPVGIQTSGFDKQHTFLMNKQPGYYAELLSKNGFHSEKQLNAYCVDLNEHYQVPPILVNDANSALDSGYRVRLMKKSDIEPCLHHYNERWQSNFAHTELSSKELHHLIRNMKLYLDTRFCFVVEKNNQLCGYLFTFPDFNQTLKQWQGRTSLIKLLGFLFEYKLKRKVHGLKTAIIGVDSEHTGKKLSSLMNKALLESAIKSRCRYIERSWILEDNYASIKQAQRMGGGLYKTYSLFSRPIANSNMQDLDEAV